MSILTHQKLIVARKNCIFKKAGYSLSYISKLLAVIETYLKETWNAELRVIASE